MKIQITVNVLLTIFILVTVTSCNSSKFDSATQMLQSMNIDQSIYSKMSVCQQIRVYTDVGMRFLDLDHMVAIVPSWVDNEVNSQTRGEVAECISQEGFYRLSLLAAQPDSKEDISLAINALIYKADQLKLSDSPQVQPLLDAAICKSNLDNKFNLILIYYFAKNKKTPEYFMQDDATGKMQAELCNK